MPTIEQMIECYSRVKNLKLAAAELGMKFQTLYWYLKKNGQDVTGDKERYGSVKDRFASKAERIFQSIVPFAKDMNKTKFQAEVDFLVGDTAVEVKAAKRNSLGVGAGGDRWAFSIKKQIKNCDFFALFAFDKEGSLEKIFLVPAELIVGKFSISISCHGRSKWHDYEVSEDELLLIFADVTNQANRPKEDV